MFPFEIDFEQFDHRSDKCSASDRKFRKKISIFHYLKLMSRRSWAEYIIVSRESKDVFTDASTGHLLWLGLNNQPSGTFKDWQKHNKVAPIHFLNQ